MSGTDATANKLELLSSDDVSRTVARIAHQIIEKRRSIPRTHRGSFCLAFPLVACHLHSA